jgi:hypothetical protein
VALPANGTNAKRQWHCRRFARRQVAHALVLDRQLGAYCLGVAQSGIETIEYFDGAGSRIASIGDGNVETDKSTYCDLFRPPAANIDYQFRFR